jgi:hypothetical protein
MEFLCYLATELAQMIEIRSNDSAFTTEAFLALVQRVWPGEYDHERTAAALARSVNVGAWDGGRLVGAVRYRSTDQTTRASPTPVGRTDARTRFH